MATFEKIVLDFEAKSDQFEKNAGKVNTLLKETNKIYKESAKLGDIYNKSAASSKKATTGTKKLNDELDKTVDNAEKLEKKGGIFKKIWAGLGTGLSVAAGIASSGYAMFVSFKKLLVVAKEFTAETKTQATEAKKQTDETKKRTSELAKQLKMMNDIQQLQDIVSSAKSAPSPLDPGYTSATAQAYADTDIIDANYKAREKVNKATVDATKATQANTQAKETNVKSTKKASKATKDQGTETKKTTSKLGLLWAALKKTGKHMGTVSVASKINTKNMKNAGKAAKETSAKILKSSTSTKSWIKGFFKMGKSGVKTFKGLSSAAKSFATSIPTIANGISKLSGGVGKVGSLLTGTFTSTLLPLGAMALGMKKLYSVSKDNIQSQAMLRNNISRTEEATGRGAKFYKKLGKEMKGYTGERMADVNKSMSMMTTFTKISTSNMSRFGKAAADSAAAWGEGTKESIRKIGKILQNPTSLGALEEIGVKMTDAEQKQIKYLHSIGDTAKAQDLILTQIESKFGGTAEKLNNTIVGDVETAMGKFNDALSMIAKTILPPVTAVISIIGDVVGFLADLGEAAVAVGVALAGLIPWLLTLIPVLGVFVPGVAVLIGAFVTLSGIIKLVSSLFSPAIDYTKQYTIANKELAKSIKTLNTEMNNVKKSEALVRQLKTLKEGSKEYKKVLNELMRLNPKLSEANIDLSSSYDNVSTAMYNLNKRASESLLLKIRQLKATADLNQIASANAYDTVDQDTYWAKGLKGKAYNAAYKAHEKKRTELARIAATALQNSMRLDAKKARILGKKLDNKYFESKLRAYRSYLNDAGVIQTTASYGETERQKRQRERRNLAKLKAYGAELKIEKVHLGKMSVAGQKSFAKFQASKKYQREWEIEQAKGIDKILIKLRHDHEDALAAFDIRMKEAKALRNRKAKADAIKNVKAEIAAEQALYDHNVKNAGKPTAPTPTSAPIKQRYSQYQAELELADLIGLKKKMFIIEKDYKKKLAQLDIAYNKAIKDNDIDAIEDLENEKLALSELTDKKKLQTSVEYVNDLANFANDSLKKIMDGDFTGLAQSALEKFGGQWGALASTGIDIAKTIFEAFGSESETWAEAFEKKMNTLSMTFNESDTATDLMQMLGLLTGTEVNQQNVDTAEEAVTDVLNAIRPGFTEADMEMYLANRDSLTREQKEQLVGESQSAAMLRKAYKDARDSGTKIDKYGGTSHYTIEGREATKAQYEAYIDNMYNTSLNKFIENISKAAETYKEYLEKYQTAKTEKSAFDISILEHKIAMGADADDEYYEAMDKAYDDLLGVMEESGATDQEIWAVQEAQYALQQEQLDAANETNDLLSDSNNSDELNALIANRDALQAAIDSGAVRDDLATNLAMQAMLDDIIAQGLAEGVDVSDYQTARNDLTSAYYGNTWSGLTGSGSAVNIAPSPITPAWGPSSTNNTTNTNNYTSNINGAPGSDDIAELVINTIQQRYGINVLTGGY